MAYSESNLECTTRDTWNMEQAKWQLVLMLKKSRNCDAGNPGIVLEIRRVNVTD